MKANSDLVQTSPDRHSVKVNRLALALLTAAAVTIGVAPALMMLDRPLWVLIAGILALIAAMVGAFVESTDTIAIYQPSWQEFLLAGLGTIFIGAATGILVFIVAGLSYVAALLPIVNFLVYFLGILFGLFAALSWASSPSMMKDQLYPDAAGVRSAFFPLLTIDWRRKLFEYLKSHWRPIIVAALAVCLCVYGLFALWGRTGVYLALNLALLICAYPSFVATAIPGHFNGSEVQAIKTVLEAAGCRVMKLRTGDPASDPLLLELDLLVVNGQRAMAVAVRTRAESPAAVEATTVSALSLAAWTCGRNNISFELQHTSIEPWLILIDREITDDAETIAEQRSIRIFRLTKNDLRRIDQSKNAIDLPQIALDYFGLTAGGELEVCAGKGEVP